MTSTRAVANQVPAPRSVVPALRLSSPGRPLPREVRLDAEARFGHDFSRVRIYADDESARAAASARAFTVGHDIFFDTGQYAPSTAPGFRLLAHELSHVVQADRRRRGSSSAVAARDSEAERQARRWADQAAHGPAGPAAGETAAPPHVLMREEKKEDAPAAVEPDFAWLAFEVFDAMEGPGTDEERVYRALEQLRKDPDLIKKFREAYKKYGDLDADLDDDFSGSELEYALQLINKGTAGSEQEVVAGKAGPSDLPEIVRRLHRAFFDEPGTDEEAVFAQLVRLDHDPDLIADLETVYRNSSNGQDLRATLEDELSENENEYQHALSLISVPYEHWIRRANEKLRRVGFGIPWGSWCGPEPKESRFPDAYDVRYWDQVEDVRNGNVVGCKLALKKDVRPSVAVAALIEEQDRWAVDCAGFVQIAHWYAMLKVAGPNRFDAAVGGPFELKKSQSTGVSTVKTFKAHAPAEAMEVHLPKNGELVRDRDAKPVDPEEALKSAPVGSRVMWTNRIFVDRPRFGEAVEVARAFENENSIKLGPDQYGAFPLHEGDRHVMSRGEIEQRMAKSATSVYPELSVADMLKHVFISEIELIDPALTGPEGARGARKPA